MQMVHICKGTFSAVLWPRVVLFSNSLMMTSGTSWPKKWNSHKQRQPNLLPQAFCQAKSAFAGSTLSNRRGSERGDSSWKPIFLSWWGSFMRSPLSGLCRSGPTAGRAAGPQLWGMSCISMGASPWVSTRLSLHVAFVQSAGSLLHWKKKLHSLLR